MGTRDASGVPRPAFAAAVLAPAARKRQIGRCCDAAHAVPFPLEASARDPHSAGTVFLTSGSSPRHPAHRASPVGHLPRVLSPAARVPMPRHDPLPLPDWNVVAVEDARFRIDAVEAPALVSADWAKNVRAASHRPFINAAKVIAALAAERPDARYVEGFASLGGVKRPEWHAWVDVPLGAAERSWLRIDATPMWRWMLEHNQYAPVLEVRASELLPHVEPLRAPRGRARCRLPVAPILPSFNVHDFDPQPDPVSLAAALGPAIAERAVAVREHLLAEQHERTAMIHVDGRAELDRLAALRVLPRDEGRATGDES